MGEDKYSPKKKPIRINLLHDMFFESLSKQLGLPPQAHSWKGRSAAALRGFCFLIDLLRWVSEVGKKSYFLFHLNEGFLREHSLAI
jgi:hypothetical protein